jgi:hypothetical protein
VPPVAVAARPRSWFLGHPALTLVGSFVIAHVTDSGLCHVGPFLGEDLTLRLPHDGDASKYLYP